MTTSSHPLVLPDPFSGVGSWESWISHFDDVAVINSWDDEQKLLWLRIRLTDRARIAYQGLLLNAAKASYEESKKALTEHFEPSSKRELYLVEWHSRRKGNMEGWAEFAEDLKRLTQNAYPDLDGTAKEQMALVQYLAQLQNPQVAISVKQKRPKTVDKAVAATLEMESYLIMPVSINTERRVNQVDMDSPIAEEDDLTVAAMGNVSYQGELYHTMKKLLERVENIEA